MSTQLTPETLRYMTVTGTTESQARNMLLDVSELDFQAYTNTNLRRIDDAIRQEVLILTAEAKKIADAFYRYQLDGNRELTDRNKSTNIIARAALRGNSLSIVWQYQMRRNKPVPGKSNAVSRVIKGTAKYGYSELQWAKLPEWIRPQVIAAEAKFKVIRERYERLVAIRSAVTAYKWSVKKDRGQKNARLSIESLPVPTVDVDA